MGRERQRGDGEGRDREVMGRRERQTGDGGGRDREVMGEGETER